MWMVLAGVLVAALVGGAVLVANAGGGTKRAPVAATPSTGGDLSATATPAPAGAPGSPSAADVQKMVADLTAQLAQSAGTSGTPLTKEEVEAQLRAQLAQLGIKY